MDYQKYLQKQRLRRRRHTRKRVRGSTERPRLTVYRSNKHIACQLVNDEDGKTLASASTRDKDLRSEVNYGGNVDAASLIGKKLAEKALALGVKQVCFDRGHYKYHGRVAAVADAAREAGLDF